jgi:hypothetical protein
MSGCPTGLPYSVSAVLRSTGFRRWLLESSEAPIESSLGKTVQRPIFGKPLSNMRHKRRRVRARS